MVVLILILIMHETDKSGFAACILTKIELNKREREIHRFIALYRYRDSFVSGKIS